MGEQVKTNSEAVLYLRSERLFEKESPYFLYKSHDDKAMTRTVPLGSVISIIYISRYKTHEGGAWLGVSGEVINSNGTTDKFIYHWSDLNGVLNIAPWENIDTDRNRNVHNLLY